MTVLIISAPTVPTDFIARLLPAANGLGPRVNLTWNKPAEENGVIRKYVLYFSESETPGRVDQININALHLWFLLNVYGRTTYTFHLSAVTIKEGPNSTVNKFTIPDYGKSNWNAIKIKI